MSGEGAPPWKGFRFRKKVVTSSVGSVPQVEREPVGADGLHATCSASSSRRSWIADLRVAGPPVVEEERAVTSANPSSSASALIAGC